MKRLVLACLALSGCASGAAPETPASPSPLPVAQGGHHSVPTSVPELSPTPHQPPSEDLLNHAVSFDLRGVPFRTAVITLSRLGQVPLIWDGDVPPATLDIPVTLTVSDLPLRKACQWLSRLVDLRVEEAADLQGPGEGGLRFATSASSDPEKGPWTLTRVDVGALVTPPPPPDLAIQRVGTFDRLVGRPPAPLQLPKVQPGEKTQKVKVAEAPAPVDPGLLEEMDADLKADRKDRTRYRREALVALLNTLKPLARSTYDHPKPCQIVPGSDRTLLIDQPARCRPWVLETLKALEALDPTPGVSEKDGVEAMDGRWSGLVALPNGDVEVGEAFRGLARQAGISVGWDVRELSGAVLRRLTLSGGHLSFGRALGLVARQAGFVGVHREAGGGAWLVGPREASRTPLGDWEDTFTLGVYPIADLDGAVGAETVQGLLRSRLEGNPWQEPGAVLAYHGLTKRLIVRQRPEVHLDVMALLDLLRREGTGPFDMGRAEGLERPSR